MKIMAKKRFKEKIFFTDNKMNELFEELLNTVNYLPEILEDINSLENNPNSDLDEPPKWAKFYDSYIGKDERIQIKTYQDIIKSSTEKDVAKEVKNQLEDFLLNLIFPTKENIDENKINKIKNIEEKERKLKELKKRKIFNEKKIEFNQYRNTLEDHVLNEIEKIWIPFLFVDSEKNRVKYDVFSKFSYQGDKKPIERKVNNPIKDDINLKKLHKEDNELIFTSNLFKPKENKYGLISLEERMKYGKSLIEKVFYQLGKDKEIRKVQDFGALRGITKTSQGVEDIVFDYVKSLDQNFEIEYTIIHKKDEKKGEKKDRIEKGKANLKRLNDNSLKEILTKGHSYIRSNTLEIEIDAERQSRTEYKIEGDYTATHLNISKKGFDNTSKKQIWKSYEIQLMDKMSYDQSIKIKKLNHEDYKKNEVKPDNWLPIMKKAAERFLEIIHYKNRMNPKN